MYLAERKQGKSKRIAKAIAHIFFTEITFFMIHKVKKSIQEVQ
jgi:hypothetical protein